MDIKDIHILTGFPEADKVGRLESQISTFIICSNSNMIIYKEVDSAETYLSTERHISVTFQPLFFFQI